MWHPPLSERLVKGEEERLLQKSGLADKLIHQQLYVPSSKDPVTFSTADRGYVRSFKDGSPEKLPVGSRCGGTVFFHHTRVW